MVLRGGAASAESTNRMNLRLNQPRLAAFGALDFDDAGDFDFLILTEITVCAGKLGQEIVFGFFGFGHVE